MRDRTSRLFESVYRSICYFVSPRIGSLLVRSPIGTTGVTIERTSAD